MSLYPNGSQYFDADVAVVRQSDPQGSRIVGGSRAPLYADDLQHGRVGEVVGPMSVQPAPEFCWPHPVADAPQFTKDEQTRLWILATIELDNDFFRARNIPGMLRAGVRHDLSWPMVRSLARQSWVWAKHLSRVRRAGTLAANVRVCNGRCPTTYLLAATCPGGNPGWSAPSGRGKWAWYTGWRSTSA